MSKQTYIKLNKRRKFRPSYQSRYSLYGKKKSSGQPMALTIFLILLIVGFIGGVGYLVLKSSASNGGGDGLVNESAFKIECKDLSSSNVKGATIGEDFPWWDYDYSTYREIVIRNKNSTKTISENCWVTVYLNHKELVDEQKSLASGKDLRVVYLKNESYQLVNYNLTDPNTEKTKLTFKLFEDIRARGQDENYFVYYGNFSIDTGRPTDEGEGYFPDDLEVAVGEEKNPGLIGKLKTKWIVKRNNVPDYENEIRYTVAVNRDSMPENFSVFYQVLGANKKGSMMKIGDGLYEASINIEDLEIGTYQVQAKVVGGGIDMKSQKSSINISYPLYVIWTFDWEGNDVWDPYLNDIDEISRKHNNIPITQLFNPSIYSNSSFTAQRRQYLTDWVKRRKTEFGDEIGLHLHMHYHMVQAAGVSPKTSPAWGGRSDGHDVLMSAYSYDELMQILAWSNQKFVENGLGMPTSFRAGGWFIDSTGLKALNDSGFLVDCSGRTSFIWGPNNITGFWNLHPTTKPYHPSEVNQNSDSPEPTLRLWEFSNNGADSWKFEAEEMIDRFDQNFDGKAVEERQAVVYLSHPQTFNVDYPKMDKVFAYTDQYLYANDAGPVIYATLEEARREWDLD